MPPEITNCLARGETIVWSGRPRPYAFLIRGLPNIAYGVTWSVLGAFWYHGSGGISEETSAFEGLWRVLPLFSIPFIIVGFSFWFYPIRLGIKARRTWYVVTNRRVFIAELRKNSSPALHVFTDEEMTPPKLVKRIDGLYNVILTLRAQKNPHLTPRLDSGFLGIENGEAAAEAIRSLPKEKSGVA